MDKETILRIFKPSNKENLLFPIPEAAVKSLLEIENIIADHFVTLKTIEELVHKIDPAFRVEILQNQVFVLIAMPAKSAADQLEHLYRQSNPEKASLIISGKFMTVSVADILAFLDKVRQLGDELVDISWPLAFFCFHYPAGLEHNTVH